MLCVFSLCACCLCEHCLHVLGLEVVCPCVLLAFSMVLIVLADVVVLGGDVSGVAVA